MAPQSKDVAQKLSPHFAFQSPQSCIRSDESGGSQKVSPEVTVAGASEAVQLQSPGGRSQLIWLHDAGGEGGGGAGGGGGGVGSGEGGGLGGG